MQVRRLLGRSSEASSGSSNPTCLQEQLEKALEAPTLAEIRSEFDFIDPPDDPRLRACGRLWAIPRSRRGHPLPSRAPPLAVRSRWKSESVYTACGRRPGAPRGPAEAQIRAGEVDAYGDGRVEATARDPRRAIRARDVHETDGEAIEVIGCVIRRGPDIQHDEDQHEGVERLAHHGGRGNPVQPTILQILNGSLAPNLRPTDMNMWAPGSVKHLD